LTVSKLCILGKPQTLRMMMIADDAMNLFKDDEVRNERRYLVIADLVSGSVGPEIFRG
jgi:hypothetical protein